jgi:hypothetical protein
VDAFVSLDDGAGSLKNILIPVASSPPAIQAAVRKASRCRCGPGAFTLLHVGGQENLPDVRFQQLAGWRWEKIAKSGGVIDVVDRIARETDLELIVMSTVERNGFLDALRRGHSERVLRQSRGPVLVILAGGYIASVL